MLKLILSVPRDRRWWVPLALVNLGGALYGFHWYRAQLMETPFVLWPLVADSPIAVLLFSLFMLTLLLGRRVPLLEALAYFANIKYGAWTVIVMALTWRSTGQLDFQTFHLTLSHGAMVIQVLLFSPRFRPYLSWVLVATAWFVINDYADYTLGFHPALPAPELLPIVAAISRWSTVLVAAYLVYLSQRRDRA